MIKYKDLSGWLKVAVIGMWIVTGIYVLAFMVGFIWGVYL